MHQKNKIAVIIPCYNVRNKIESVLNKIPDFVDNIYVIDDACLEKSGQFVRDNITDKRINVITHETNQGVGAAVLSGYKAAEQDKMDIAVKIDGDGQMDPALIELFLRPIIDGRCDYTKGNRFYNIENLKDMPKTRLLGNAFLSFLTKISSGYWHLFDPTNGYTAIHLKVFQKMNSEKISKRYFFETDILYHLNILRAKIIDIPMESVYEDEKSSLQIKKIIFPFLAGHLKNFYKRIFYNYLIRDFSVATLELFFGVLFLLFGVFYGSYHWNLSNETGISASAGTVMLSSLPILIGLQFLLSFLNYDIQSVPKDTLHIKL